MPATSASSAASLDSRFGAKPPSSPTPPPSPRSCRCCLRWWKTSAPMRSASAKRVGADRDDHELLEVDRVVGVRAAVEDVHHRHRQDPRRLAAEVAPQRLVLLGRGRARGGERDAEDRVRAEAALVRRAVELDQRAVEARLVEHVAARDRLGDLAVDVRDRPASRPCRGRRRRRRAARSPRTRRSRRRTGPPRGRARRSAARARPRRSGCRASRGSGGRGRSRSGSSSQCSSCASAPARRARAGRRDRDRSSPRPAMPPGPRRPRRGRGSGRPPRAAPAPGRP